MFKTTYVLLRPRDKLIVYTTSNKWVEEFQKYGFEGILHYSNKGSSSIRRIPDSKYKVTNAQEILHDVREEKLVNDTKLADLPLLVGKLKTQFEQDFLKARLKIGK